MTVTLDVVYFNYLDRPIFDANVDGKAGDSSDPYPDTGASTITDVTFKLGEKSVSWRLDGPPGMARNGETVLAKNKPQLTGVPSDARYLAIHIYPGDTVELSVSRHFPRPTDKGITLAKARGR